MAALLADNEHRDAGIVLRGVEALLDLIVVGIEGEPGRLPFARFAARDIVAIDRCRAIEAGEGEEGFLRPWTVPPNPAAVPIPGKRNLALEA